MVDGGNCSENLKVFGTCLEEGSGPLFSILFSFFRLLAMVVYAGSWVHVHLQQIFYILYIQTIRIFRGEKYISAYRKPGVPGGNICSSALWCVLKFVLIWPRRPRWGDTLSLAGCMMSEQTSGLWSQSVIRYHLEHVIETHWLEEEFSHILSKIEHSSAPNHPYER